MSDTISGDDHLPLSKDDTKKVSTLLSLITRIKPDYLDVHKVGVRRFAEMTQIRRNRLVQILDGRVIPTIGEFDRINTGLNTIEQKHKKLVSAKSKSVSATKKPEVNPTTVGFEDEESIII